MTPGPTPGQSALPRTQASLSKTGGRSGHRPSRARPSVWGSDLEVPLWTGAPPWGTSSACLGPPRGVCLGLCHHVPSESQNAADTPVHLQGDCAGAGRWEWGWGWHACQPPFLPLILRARCFPAQVLTGERPAEEGPTVMKGWQRGEGAWRQRPCDLSSHPFRPCSLRLTRGPRDCWLLQAQGRRVLTHVPTPRPPPSALRPPSGLEAWPSHEALDGPIDRGKILVCVVCLFVLLILARGHFSIHF